MVSVTFYRPISLDDIDVEPLADEAWADGYPFVERMRHDWTSGDNRFDGPGERLIGAFEGETLIGFCGLNRDPYVSENAGRIRLRSTPASRSFYEQLGFEEVEETEATHSKRLR